jgi:hypothetical protein
MTMLSGQLQAAPLTPTLQWSWTSSAVEPNSLNVMSTPSVMDLNGDGKPDVIFGSTASTGGGSVEVGVLRALNGATGAELFTVADPGLRINSAASVATGDIDGDKKPDIIAVDSSGRRLIAFNSVGSFMWRSAELEAINWGAPSIADLNGDGSPEIVIGRQVVSNTGVLLWTGAGSNASGGNVGPLSLVSDVDQDGKPDVVAGNTVYGTDGSIKNRNVNLPDGYNAVGNFGGDSKAEIVLVANGQVWLLNHDMTVRWGPVAIPGGGFGGPPTVADFDGDGKPDVGVAGASRYVVIGNDGSVKWSTVTQDSSSNRTGSSVFDFQKDGSAEVVYGDELFLRVYDGKTGGELFKVAKSSCTWHEYPLVADVDADGHAEILGVANNNCGFGPQRGVYVWGDDDTWVDTRDVWNQHTYHITNVAQDGTIPVNELTNWLVPGLNDFRLNQYLPGEDPNVPEPSALALAALAIGLMGLRSRRKTR